MVLVVRVDVICDQYMYKAEIEQIGYIMMCFTPAIVERRWARE